MTNLTVVCVNVNDYLGKGQEYVDKLHAMVKRNLNQPFQFKCITDSPMKGWWAKVGLFRPGQFQGRVMYIDLDSVITGSLDQLVEHKGIIDMYGAHWGKNRHEYNSSVMVWDAGEHEEIFNEYSTTVPTCFIGDQDWMTYLGGWDGFPNQNDSILSYKWFCEDIAPKYPEPTDCKIWCFHGKPKPHEIDFGWVPEYWKL
jgi:hypothetical protein